MVIKPASRKGLSLVLSASYGLSYIKDENLSSMTLQRNYHEWGLKNDYGISVGLGVQYFINDNLSVSLGAGYSTYKANFSLDGTFADQNFSTDANFELFNKVIIASIDSMVTLNYISVPLYVNYTSGKPGKLGFYVDAGMNISYLISSGYNTTGSYEYLGYYPSHPALTRYNREPEYGFYVRDYIDETGKTDASSLNLSLYGSAGVSIPFGYYSTLNIGPEIVYGLSDIMKDRSQYTDIFGNITDSKATKIQKIGLRIGFVYKL